MAPRKKSVTEIAQDADAQQEPAAPAKTTARSAHGKKTTPKRATVKKGNRRKDRSTAATKAGGVKKPKGRLTAPQIVARNAEIAKLREVALWEWDQIAVHFSIDNSTARRGYDSHVEARNSEAMDFKRALADMRRYVQVLVRNQQALAEISHELEMSEPQVIPGAEGEEPTTIEAKKIKQDVRARVAAMHEQVEQMFKEIAVRQAIGDLPTRFSELVAARDWESSYDLVMEVLKRHNTPHAVFVEIAAVMDERINAPVPKTHLSVVND